MGHRAQHLQCRSRIGSPLAQGLDDVAQDAERGRIALARAGKVVGRQVVVQEVLLEMDDVGRQLVLELGVVAALAPQEDDGVRVLGERPDDLVDPAGDAAADVGKGALQQQRDVSLLGFRMLAHRALQ